MTPLYADSWLIPLAGGYLSLELKRWDTGVTQYSLYGPVDGKLMCAGGCNTLDELLGYLELSFNSLLYQAYTFEFMEVMDSIGECYE